MEGVVEDGAFADLITRASSRRTTMSLRLSNIRQLVSVGEIAGFFAAWMVVLWVALQSSVQGERPAPPSNLASATETANPVSAIK
jgi:hypothetical protein